MWAKRASNSFLNASATPLLGMDTFSTRVNGRSLVLENHRSNPDMNNIGRRPPSKWAKSEDQRVVMSKALFLHLEETRHRRRGASLIDGWLISSGIQWRKMFSKASNGRSGIQKVQCKRESSEP